MSRRVHAYVGVIIGLLGWMIGVSIICLATGQFALLADVLPVGLAASLGLAAVTLALLELAARRFGDSSAMAKLCLLGVLLVDIGILLLLANHWLMPMIQANAAAAGAINAIPGVTSVPDGVPVAMLIAAVIALVIVARRAIRVEPRID